VFFSIPILRVFNFQLQLAPFIAFLSVVTLLLLFRVDILEFAFLILTEAVWVGFLKLLA
jgi:hypothetical protein